MKHIELTEGACLASCLCICVVSCFVCFCISLSVLGVIVGLVASITLICTYVQARERALQDAYAAQMPEVLRSLSGALSSGKSIAQAIEHAGQYLAEPMSSEFLQTSFEIQGGCPSEEAIESLCKRIDAPGCALLGTALQISQRTGSALTDLFARTARMVSDTVTLRRQLHVKTSQVRLSSRVIALLPVILCGILTLLSRDYRSGLALGAGRTCLVIAALLDIGALLLIRAMMNRSLQ